MAFRTQKISQMTPKGADLEATDLIEVSTIESGSYVTRSITGQELIDAIPATVVEWGDIGGTLSTQTDLQSALNAKVPTTRTLTINGTTQDLSADRTFTVATGITIGTTAITSGVVGRVLFEGAGNVVQESANLFWDNTNGRLGIGGTPGAFNLDVNGTARVSGNTTILTNGGRLILQQTVLGGVFNGINFNDFTSFTDASITNNQNSGEFRIFTASSYFPTLYSNGLERMRIPTSGNVLIGTTTDAGFRLDVNGTARVQGTITINDFVFNGNTGIGFFRNINDWNFFNISNGSVKYRITGATQGFGISDNVYDAVATSAMLQVNSTTKGFLPPRMTTTQKNAIASPATGLMVYDTTLNRPCFYDGTTWITL